MGNKPPCNFSQKLKLKPASEIPQSLKFMEGYRCSPHRTYKYQATMLIYDPHLGATNDLEILKFMQIVGTARLGLWWSQPLFVQNLIRSSFVCRLVNWRTLALGVLGILWGVKIYQNREKSSFPICKKAKSVLTPTMLSHMKNKKAVLSQRWPHDAPYIWVHWVFECA